MNLKKKKKKEEKWWNNGKKQQKIARSDQMRGKIKGLLADEDEEEGRKYTKHWMNKQLMTLIHET